MNRPATQSEVSRRFGELTSAKAIEWERINVEGLLRVLGRLTRAEVQQVKLHLDQYERNGHASDYLLGILVMSAGTRRGKVRRATVMPLQKNVVGITFG